MKPSIKHRRLRNYVSIFLGLFFLIAGIGMVFGTYENFPTIHGEAGEFYRTVSGTYLFEWIGIFKLIAAFLMFNPITRIFAPVFTFAYAINILLWNVLWAHEAAYLGIPIFIMHVFLLYCNFDYYKPVFGASFRLVASE